MAIVKLQVELTPYGVAALRYQRAAKRATWCEVKVRCASSWRGTNAPLGDRCGCLAKVIIGGVKMCQKHASMTLMEAALKGKR